MQVAISPDGTSAYAVNASAGATISQYDVDPGDGTLTPKATPTVGAGSAAYGIAVSPDGRSVYAANRVTGGTIAQFSIAANGTLSPLRPALVAPALCRRASSPPQAACTWPTSVTTRSRVRRRPRRRAHDQAGRTGRQPGQPLRPGARARRRQPVRRRLRRRRRRAVRHRQRRRLERQMPSSCLAPASAYRRGRLKPRDVQPPLIDLRTPPRRPVHARRGCRRRRSCADEGGSALASCTGDVPDDDALDTTKVGDHASASSSRRRGTRPPWRTTTPSRGARRAGAHRRPAHPVEGAQYERAATSRPTTRARTRDVGLASCTGDLADGDHARHHDARAP